MSADNDNEDSRMLSSPEASDTEPSTPKDTTASDPANLSPPDSQHGPRRAMPSAGSAPSNGANSNGKRPINTISNGTDDHEELAATATAKARPDNTLPIVKTHAASGYSWSRIEDEPGYAWLNKKALDEANRTWDAMVHKESAVCNKYGDVFEMVEREQAKLAAGKEN